MIAKKPTKGLLSRALWIFRHELFVWSRLIGMRDRLRCPCCRKVGTWKPHRPPRRWLCKWCGYYVDIKGDAWAYPCSKQKVWMLKPKQKGKLPSERCGRLDPWKG